MREFSGKMALAASKYGKEKDYWLNKLAGEWAKSSFPFDRGQDKTNITYKLDVTGIHFNHKLVEKIVKIAKDSDYMLHMILVAGVAALIGRYTCHKDIIMGMPVYKREIEGELLNTALVLRNQLADGMSFKELLLQVRQTIIEADKNQNYPVETLLYHLDMSFSGDDFPLFDIVVLLENIHQKKDIIHTHPNIIFSFVKNADRIEGIVEYHSLLYDKETIQRIIEYFSRLLEEAIFNIDMPVLSLDILSEEEKEQLLYDFNRTQREYPFEKTIDVLFQEQAEKNPDKIAVSDEEDCLAYKMVNERSRRLAVYLQAKGLSLGEAVGITVENSCGMVTGILGILKAGGGYLPINSDYPEERRKYLLKDVGASKVLTRTHDDSYEGVDVIGMDDPGIFATSNVEDPQKRHSSGGLAYIMYTSGSTGNPKGVMIEHRSVIRLVKNTNFVELQEEDGILQTGALDFDASTFEIWGALLNGLQLYLVSKEVILTPEMIKSALQENRVTTIWMTSPLFNQLVDEDIEIFRGIRNLIVGGDVLSPAHINRVRRMFPALKIINGYGPTENTTFSITHLIDREYQANIPIGKPIANSTAYILDQQNRPVPIGMYGELCVGGDGLARGYLNNPELTAERFYGSYRSYKTYINYHTGDLARWLPGGNIEFLGRIDHQVKIRGYRIEPGEIENQLTRLDNIAEAVLVDKGIGKEKYLCAYIVSEGNRPLDFVELKNLLSERMPDYMVPSYFVQVDRIPLNPNGKVDRKLLPEPQLKAGENYAAPRDHIERSLVSIWSGVLNLENEVIGIDTDFFQLGGHSLKATLLTARMHKEFNVKIPLAEVFKKPTIRELSAYIKEAAAQTHAGHAEHAAHASHLDIEKVEEKEYYELSSAQKRLYVLQQLNPAGTFYNVAFGLELPGELDIKKAQKIFQALIQRHESLRTSFQPIAGEPVQRIHDHVDFAIETLATEGTPYEDTEVRNQHSAFITQHFIHNFIRPFDLSRAPLVRVSIIKEKEKPSLLMIDMHHIITDGTSMTVLLKEIKDLFAGKKLPPLKLQYKDYSEWQRSDLQKKAVENQEKYWLCRFADEIPVLDLPLDFKRPDVQSFEGNALHFELPGEQNRELNTLSSHMGVTLYIMLLSIYNVLLFKLSGQEDIIVGAPIAARRHVDLEGIIGMFVNTLAMRNCPVGERTFKDFLQEVKGATLEAFENQEYPFEDLVAKVDITRDAGRNPLFDVMFVLQNFYDATETGSLSEGKERIEGFDQEIAKFDLTLAANEEKERLYFAMEYCTRLFKEETVLRFVQYFKRITASVIKNPGQRLAEIEILTTEEKNCLLNNFNNPETAYPKNKTIQQLFLEQVEKSPGHIAIVGANRHLRVCPARDVQNVRNVSLTYRHLNEQSDRLAGVLIEKGVLPDDIIAIKVERSIEMIIGILGILKAGGAYMPIDSEYPQDRIDYMLKDSSAKLLAVDNDLEGEKVRRWEGELLAFANRSEGEKLGRWEGEKGCPRHGLHHSSQLAYIIYTSGSTGKPKGVLTTHANVTRVVKDTNYIDIKPGDRLLQLSNYAFDGSVFDIYGALLNGAELVMISKDDILDVRRLSEVIKREGITVFFITTALFNTLVDMETGCFDRVRKVLFGGERVSVEHAAKALAYLGKGRIIHVYGPTETTVYATYYFIDAIDDASGNIPIGKPISNTTVYIFDKYLNPVPIGVSGEIYIGGAGVARGYLNNPELTRGTFEKAPLDPPKLLPNYHSPLATHHSPIYKTGDLARWLNDGNIEFLGRIDHQVKIRGFRIELGEIENRLRNHTHIKEVVVEVKTDENGDKYLCAYIVSAKELESSKLKAYLAGDLPGYMIPAHFVFLEKIPLTPNGKIDRKALPRFEREKNQNCTPPRDEVEKKLLTLWLEILGKDRLIGIDDNFFEVGGHSLRATILTSGIQKELNVRVPLAEVFKCLTIRELARYIRAASKEIYTAVEPAEKREYYPLSSAQRRFYILQEITPESTAYNITGAYEIEGYVDKDKFERSLRMLINRHAILRTSFETSSGNPGNPVQRVHDEVAFRIEYLAADTFPQHRPTRTLTEVLGGPNRRTLFQKGSWPTEAIIKYFIRPFDLSKAPLLRVSLVEISPDRHILLFDMHHIISDGTSMAIFLKEFMVFYSGGNLPSLPLQYKDFANWQHDLLTTGKLKKQQAYWIKKFSGELPVLNMPTDFPRPAMQSFEGNISQFKLEKSLTVALKGLIKETGTTLYMVLLAVYNILLARYTGQEDIVIGSTIAGRHHIDLQGIMGLLIETLVQRNYPMGHLDFKTFLEMVKQETLETHENQAFPFREIIRLVGADNEISRNPVFDAMLIVQNFESAEFHLEGLKFSPYRLAEEYLYKTSKVDFTIDAMEMVDSAEIHLTLEYCTRLYKPETMERFARHFLNIIGEITANPLIPLAAIEVIDESERKQLLETFNDTTHKSSIEEPRMVVDRFEDQAAKTPDRIAIIGLGQIVNDMVFLTYRGLHDYSDALAAELTAKGVEPGTIAAIMMESSVEMAVGIWGILKAGGAYLPIVPGSPVERIDYMLKDSNARILINKPEARISKPESPRRGLQHSNLAYIIYTSGTTGHPKGVMVEHRNLANYVSVVMNELCLRADDTVLQQGSYAFDAFVEEFYLPLVTGAKMAIPGKMLTRDMSGFCQFIARHRANMITSTPQMLNELNKVLKDGLPAPLDARELLSSLRIVILGGDLARADHIDMFLETAEVYNTYGPTESTVCATYYRCPALNSLSGGLPIGKPLARTEIYINDKYGNPAPIGVGGELCVAGPGVARGYLNNPELTAERFNRSYGSNKTYILYKTGDLARWLEDGNIEFLGRIDRQIKIRGYRIEPAEIENQLTGLANITEAVVIDETRKSGDKYLAAYVVGTGTFDAAEIKSRLSRQLPDYMIPTYVIKVEQIPRTSAGKVDRKRLTPPQDVTDSQQTFIAPGSDTEKRLAGIWQQILEKERVGIDDNFFDLGGTSLDIMKLNTRIKEEFNKPIPVVSLFKYTTIRTLTQLLLLEEETGNKGNISLSLSIEKQKELEILEAIKRGQAKFKGRSQGQAEAGRNGFEIAVIGMSGIFPGSHNLPEFWENLKNGVETIHFFSDEELLEDGVDKASIANPNYVGARGIIEGVEYFDASFFGYTPLEAQIMDPQMRIFQQTVWHALEDAGYDPFSYQRRIGLYAGASPNYYWTGLTLFSGISRNVSGFMAAQLADKDFMCTHTSYKLNLKGPSVSLQTACSTSLVAIHYAVQGLLHGECEMALAGGVSIAYPYKRGYIYQPGMIFSSDGHNRSFDARANGSIFGDGVGVVVLKSLTDAVADRDHIYAVIKGSAINNDGLRKVGYTAPGLQGQVEVICAAQSMAEVAPETVTYIEAHGTATPLGDTVEIEALKQVFQTDKKRFCAVGTLKSNMGHLYSAAGAAGFIKTVLALNHRLIPPSLHFQNPNPQIDFQNSPFYVNTSLKEWKNEQYPLRAGVSSFGIGGTNAHVVLEEWGEKEGSREECEVHEERKLKLLLISARTPFALNKMTENLVRHLQENPAANLGDVAYTLQVGRKHFPYRRMMVSAASEPGQDAGLLAQAAQRAPIAQAKEENRPIIFMFCGQGSQYVNMGIDLYHTEPVFRQELDNCFEILRSLVDYNVKDILYPSPGNNRSNGSYRTYNIDQTEIAQPVLFIFEYALAKLLISWGIRPTAMTGYSFGEYVAACLAGVFSPEEALEMIVTRGQLVRQTPVGKMTSVTLPEHELKPLLKEGVSIAIVNGPTCIVSGQKEDIEAFEKEMKQKRLICVPLNMSHAVHSPVMNPIRGAFEQKISRFHLNKPQIPFISNVTARWVMGNEVTTPGYWGDHLCSTVRFSDGLTELLKQENAIFIEIGPGRILGMMIRVHAGKKPGHLIINSVKHPQENVADDYFLMEKLGQLWQQGQVIDWGGFYGQEKRIRVSLPGYPFEGKRYWIEPKDISFSGGMPAVVQGPAQVDVDHGGRGDSDDAPQSGSETVAPRNEVELLIARMWKELMGLDSVGIHDDFFRLNGSSLVATQIIARLMQEYNIEISMNSFYEQPTIAHLAELIEKIKKR